jgi:transposase
MKKDSTRATSSVPVQVVSSEQQHHHVIGLDLGDDFSQVCLLVMTSGEIEEETRLRTTPEALRRYFGKLQHARIALETGTHSPWVSRLLEELGHQVLVANARHLRLVYQNDRKNDQLDAENLARLARLDPKLLHPIRHRGEKAQADLAVIRSRHLLVTARTQLINHVRGMTKAFGERLPKGGSDSFHLAVRELIPPTLRAALLPILEAIASLNEQIKMLDQQIRELSNSYPETKLLRQVAGVGPVTALAFILTLEDQQRFRKSRTVGAFLGLTPSRAQSGSQDPKKGISKQGDNLVRTLLTQCAQHILRTTTPDSDLKRFGERLLAKGGKGARGRAVTGVARKLAVLLHRLWVTGEHYQPLYNLQRQTSLMPPHSTQARDAQPEGAAL